MTVVILNFNYVIIVAKKNRLNYNGYYLLAIWDFSTKINTVIDVQYETKLGS